MKTTAQDEEFTQRAFIAHCQGDKHWGEWLQKALESYHVPARLVGRDSRDGPVPRRILPTYRDNDEIKDSKDIGATRRNLLKQSRYLIVICSPESAISPWVKEEIMEFKRLGRENRILCLIVDGEPNASDKPAIAELECFNEALRYKADSDGVLSELRAEPIAADLRTGKDGKDGARLKILAGILGVSFDDLRQRDLRRRRIQRIQLAVLLILMIAAAIVIGIKIKQQALENAYQSAEYAVQEAKRLVQKGDVENAIETTLNNLPPDYSESEYPVVDELMWVLEDAVSQIPIYSILTGHKAEILNMQFSPNGKYLYTTARDWSARIWDVANGVEIAKHEISNLNAISFSPSGGLVASANFDKTVSVWHAETGQDIQILKGHSERVNSLVFNSDGKRLLTGSQDGTARLWDIESGNQLIEFPGHEDDVSYVAFDATEKVIITITSETIRFWNLETEETFSVINDNTLGYIRTAKLNTAKDKLITVPYGGYPRIWDVKSGKQIGALGNEVNEYTDFALNQEANRIATASSLGSQDYSSAQLWDAKSGERLAVLRGHRDKVTSIAFNPDGTVLLTGSKDGTARLWSAFSRNSIGILRGHSDQITQVAFSPDGDLFATSSADGTTRVWNLESKTSKATLSHKSWLFDANYDQSGKRIITASLDSTMTIWDANSFKSLVQIQGHGNGVVRAFFNPDGNDPYKDRIVSVSLDRSFRNWDAQTGNELAVTWLKKGIWEAALSSNGKYLATAFDDGLVALWNLVINKYIGELTSRFVTGESNDGAARSIKFSSDNSLVAVAYASKGAGRSADAQVYETKYAKLLFILSGHRESLRDIAFHPNNNLVATASEDKTARIWKLDPDTLDLVSHLHKGESDNVKIPERKMSEQLVLLQGHADGIFSLAFSHNGDRIVTASRDGTARVWNTNTGDELVVLSGHTDEVNTAEFDPSDNYIVTASEDRTVRLWDANTGEQVNVYRDHLDSVKLAIFSPSGHEILSASYDNTARVFDVKPMDTERLINRANNVMAILGH